VTEKPSSDTDITEPFLVLLIKGKEIDGLNTLYDLRLINPTSSKLTNVCTDTGGFDSEDDGVVNSTGKAHQFGDLAPGESITIEEPDSFELGDFVVWWSVTFGNPKRTLKFALFKDRDGVPISPIPCIGGEGILIRTFRH
jgi:hypothetical protein